MASSAASDYADMYKSRNTCNTAFRQSERRVKLLREQKQKRNSAVDDLRGIEDFVEKLDHPNKRQLKKHNENPYKNKLQQSEWLMERPEDFANWYLVPCPKGKRCMIVATNGQTKVFNKYGAFMREFRSNLPGDHKQRHLTSILDCVYTQETKEYYVLDVIAYANQDLTQCDVSCRFYWLQSKVEEDELSTVSDTNDYAMKTIQVYDCADDMEIESCLNAFPLWENNQPVLDGLLFYHKEASYVHGTTPLVGWALTYMVPEILGYPFLNYINVEYFAERPADYTDYTSFIKQFDVAEAKRKKEQKRHPHRRYHKVPRMDVEVDDDVDTVDGIFRAESQKDISGQKMDVQEIDDNVDTSLHAQI